MCYMNHNNVIEASQIIAFHQQQKKSKFTQRQMSKLEVPTIIIS